LNQYSDVLVIVFKLLLTMVCGGVIGVERELSRKPAGLRTNILICMGAALYMIISRHISGGAPYTDPARLAAQVVAGIGFIGAGVIFQSRASVTGLTTAATIFLVGAVGIAIGESMYGPAMLATLLVIVVLRLLRPIERSVLRSRRLFHYSFFTNDPGNALSQLLDLLGELGLHLDSYKMTDAGGGAKEVAFTIVTSLEGNARLIDRIHRLGPLSQTSTGE
jgi:putative Mg2+ transporter-C (MgtC) family protein